jgi:hypothetical protein
MLCRSFLLELGGQLSDQLTLGVFAVLLVSLAPSHTAVVEEDFESVEFSPSAAHQQVLDVVKRNAAMAQTASRRTRQGSTLRGVAVEPGRCEQEQRQNERANQRKDYEDGLARHERAEHQSSTSPISVGNTWIQSSLTSSTQRPLLPMTSWSPDIHSPRRRARCAWTSST